MAKEIAVENFGDCTFCHQPIRKADDKTSYGHDYYTKKQTYAHWDCYHEAMENPAMAKRAAITDGEIVVPYKHVSGLASENVKLHRLHEWHRVTKDEPIEASTKILLFYYRKNREWWVGHWSMRYRYGDVEDLWWRYLDKP